MRYSLVNLKGNKYEKMGIIKGQARVIKYLDNLWKILEGSFDKFHFDNMDNNAIMKANREK
jgi:hypothetical protein